MTKSRITGAVFRRRYGRSIPLGKARNDDTRLDFDGDCRLACGPSSENLMTRHGPSNAYSADAMFDSLI